MYTQRYGAVIDCLTDEKWFLKIQKVVDIGYSDMSFIKYLKDVPEMQTVLGVDVQKINLRCAWDMYSNRKEPLQSNQLERILLLQGNAADPDYRLIGCDAVTAIEVIEHMNPQDLERLVHTIFGFIKPLVAVITTPNKDFNVLFKNMEKNDMRHWDHRFEWTREQFNDWCSNIVERYPNYEVVCKGVGPPPAGAQYNVGCCSQLAQFSAKHYKKQYDLTPDSLRVLLSSLPEPGGKSALDMGWEDLGEVPGALSASSTASPTSLFDRRTTSESQLFWIPGEFSNATVRVPALEYTDKTLQCNLPAELGRSFMMFSEDDECCRTLVPQRRGEGDHRVYEIEDVASRLHCSTLEVKKFSKITQRLLEESNQTDGHVVREIKQLTKMLNLNSDYTTGRADETPTTWNNINWGDNAPFWNEYYEVVHEYKYPLEAKSEDCLVLELIADEIRRLSARRAVGRRPLAIPLSSLTAVVRPVIAKADDDGVRDLLEWNGYEVVGDTVIYRGAESPDGTWRGDCSTEVNEAIIHF